MKKLLFNPGNHSASTSFGLLILRVSFGAMMLTHGIPKLTGFAERSQSFFDPIGLGSPFSLGLVVFAEVLCAILIMLGLGTRISTIPLIITMFVAAFVKNAGDPFSSIEKALLFLVGFLVLLITGAGKYSIDKLIR
jgi:putative oxidoreductase